MLDTIWQTHFPGHRGSVKIVDALSTKGRESDRELQAFNFVLLCEASKGIKDPRKRSAPSRVSESKRSCVSVKADTPPRPDARAVSEPAAFPAAVEPPVAPVSAAPSKIVRTLPPLLKPSALALELMNDKNYKFIMGMKMA